MIKIKTLPLGPFVQNTRIIYDDLSKSAIVVDPTDEPQKILAFIQKENLKVEAIFCTHGHIDHVSAVSEIKQRTGAKIYLHQDDLPLYSNLQMQAQMFGIDINQPEEPDSLVKDGDELKLLGTSFKIIHTPGHSPGGICVYFESPQPMLIAGDTLFAGSVGRTDLWGGDMSKLMNSIKLKLFLLPMNTVVMPGHGPDTTIGKERDTNPFFDGEDL